MTIIDDTIARILCHIGRDMEDANLADPHKSAAAIFSKIRSGQSLQFPLTRLAASAPAMP